MGRITAAGGAAFAAAGVFAVGAVGLAWADPGASDEIGAVAQVRYKCRAFPTALDAEVDTRDASTSLGTWVLDLEDRGWQVATVDWVVGQKVTGFQQSYTHVCMEPVRR